MKQPYLDRFSGILRLYGKQALSCFADSQVVVVGIGGVGSWVAEALARSGVGCLKLIDLDDLCVTNINRQVHALTSTVGQSKVDAMRARIVDINPDCQVVAVEDFLTESTLDYIDNKAHFVVDAIDSVRPKTALIAHCKREKIPLICIGGAGGKTDPTKIKVSDISRCFNDPLLAKARNMLRRHYGFSRNPKRKFGVEAVFSDEQPVFPGPDGSITHQKSTMADGVKLDCAGGFGSITTVTSSFAQVAVSRVLKKLSQIN